MTNHPDYYERTKVLAKRLSIPFRELYVGLITGVIPWGKCLLAIALIQLGIAFHLEYKLIAHSHLQFFYPRRQFFYVVYYCCWMFSPFLFWGLFRAGVAAKLKQRLTEVFRDIGLQNNTGKLPNLIYDVPIDEMTRKLRLAKRNIAPAEFEKRKSALESALHVYVDEIRNHNEAGNVDIIYSHYPMVEKFEVKDYQNYRKSEFIVGTTRSQVVRADLLTIPHLLVAGQTGGGKSTFLRHLITTLYLSDKQARFTLIDLKGGLEFQLFEDLDRVVVAGDIGHAVGLLEELGESLNQRMNLLKVRGCKDISELYEDKRVDTPSLPRQIIVVDEAAELFLTNPLATPYNVRSAKEILSKISRQGRAVGMHLVVATQRPDTRALDSQIKANLPGVLCFQMANDASSITVLGTGRATDLPPIAGRGIWKTSQRTVEVQTPYLSPTRVETLLAPHKTEKTDPPKQVPQQVPAPQSKDDNALFVEADVTK